MGGARSTYGRQRGAYKVLVGRPEGKRRRRRREFSFKMDLQEVGLGGMDWIDLFNL